MIQAIGIDPLISFLESMSRRGGNPRALLEEIGNHLTNIADESFERRQSPSGQAWNPLSPRTMRFKKDPNAILYESGRMRDSLYHDASISSVTVGTNAFSNYGRFPYPAVHQYGSESRGIPARPFFPIDQDGRLSLRVQAELNDMAKEFMLGSWDQ